MTSQTHVPGEETFIPRHALPKKVAYLDAATGLVRSVSQAHPLPIRGGASSAFGEQIVAQITPRVQVDAVYGIRNSDVKSLTTLSGSVSAADNLWSASTGTTSGALSILQSRRSVKYKPGLGVRFRFTAAFQAGVANSFQAAGCLNDSDFLGFGYNGETFGVGHMIPGAPQIHEFTLTAAATGAETATVTLNGTAFPVSLTGGGAVEDDAAEVATNAFAGWSVTAIGGVVCFLATQAGARAGTYSYSSTGTSTATLVEVQAGANNDLTTRFVAQADWAHDTASWLDPQGLNVYEVQFGYLGAANFTFSAYNPATGRFAQVHCSQFSNDPSDVSTNLSDPTLSCGLMVQSAGSTVDVTIRGGSMFGGIDGQWHPSRDSQAHSNTQAAVSTEVNVLAIRNGLAFGGRKNRTEILPIRSSVAIAGTKPAEVKIYHNATISGALWSFHDQWGSTAEFSLTKGAVSGGHVVAAEALPGGGVVKVNLRELFSFLHPGDTLTVAVLVSGGSGSDCSASINWLED